MNTTAFELLREEIETSQERIQIALAQAPLKDFSEVQYLRGQYRGLGVTLNKLMELEAAQHQEEDFA